MPRSALMTTYTVRFFDGTPSEDATSLTAARAIVRATIGHRGRRLAWTSSYGDGMSTSIYTSRADERRDRDGGAPHLVAAVIEPAQVSP